MGTKIILAYVKFSVNKTNTRAKENVFIFLWECRDHVLMTQNSANKQTVTFHVLKV